MIYCLVASFFWIVFVKARLAKIERLVHTTPASRVPISTKLLAHKHKVIDLPDPKRGRGWRWLVAAYLSAIDSQVDFTREVYVFGVLEVAQ